MADNRVTLLKQANKLFHQGKTEAAVKEYKKILAIKPDDIEVRRIIGDLQLRENVLHDAIEQFEWIADYYLKDGFFAKAIAMFKRITRIDPNYEAALFKLADLYTKQGLVMEAKQIYLDIAEECKRQNNQKKALDMYKKILEFDRSNIKMRLLLADNYLKEGLEDNAIEEYLTAANILASKKDFAHAEELLLNTLKKKSHIKIIDKLIRLYASQNDDDKAIELLKAMGSDIHEHADLMKVLGELYLKKNMMSEAEGVFTKIAEINPEETEVIVRLGKVYMQREEYDKTYALFLPIIDKNLENQKYEEAASMLRLIIASKNAFLPALLKLAAIFKLSGKTNNLIALYESLIPIYEQRGMKEQLKGILEELIQLSDNPFSYEEQLVKLTGEVAEEIEEEEQIKENEREKEFVNYNLRLVGDALKMSEFSKAVDILKRAKSTFPKNIDLRQRLFDLYIKIEQTDAAVEEGRGLLELYKTHGDNLEYSDMVEKLSQLRPHDDDLGSLSGDEKTSIEIDFDREELAEQMAEINAAALHGINDVGDEDVLLLSDAENVTAAPQEMNVGVDMSSKYEGTKSLSSVLSEVDFYVNDGYFGDAEKLIDQLQQKYPGNQALLDKIDKLNRAKASVSQKEDTGRSSSQFEIEHEPMGFEPPMARPTPKSAPTERITKPPVEDFVIERLGDIGMPEDSQVMLHQSEDSNIEIDLGDYDLRPGFEDSQPLKLVDDGFMDSSSLGFAPEPPPWDTVPPKPKDKTASNVFELGSSFSEQSERLHESHADIDLGDFDVDIEMPAKRGGPLKINQRDYEIPAPDDFPAFDLDMDAGFKAPPSPKTVPVPTPPPLDDNLFEIETSIAEESSMAQEHQDSKMDIRIRPEELIKKPEKDFKADSSPYLEMPLDDLEIEVEADEDFAPIPAMEIDKSLLIQSPSADASKKLSDSRSHSSSAIEELDLDSIIEDSDSVYELDSPFKEDLVGNDIAFEGEEEELLQDDAFLLEEDLYLENEKNVRPELEAISLWLKELEKQRTSTIEKNMMEIFEEFKRGVDEKIGQEDYDTRYNLGIAYKEMGLLEEAIHEFLISSKHPLKFFDSVGLLGICFRDKGMFSESINWFERALEAPNRRPEEYLAVRFEMVITLKLKEDYTRAFKMCEEILKVDPGFRNVGDLYKELRVLIAR